MTYYLSFYGLYGYLCFVLWRVTELRFSNYSSSYPERILIFPWKLCPQLILPQNYLERSNPGYAGGWVWREHLSLVIGLIYTECIDEASRCCYHHEATDDLQPSSQAAVGRTNTGLCDGGSQRSIKIVNLSRLWCNNCPGLFSLDISKCVAASDASVLPIHPDKMYRE